MRKRTSGNIIILQISRISAECWNIHFPPPKTTQCLFLLFLKNYTNSTSECLPASGRGKNKEPVRVLGVNKNLKTYNYCLRGHQLKSQQFGGDSSAE